MRFLDSSLYLCNVIAICSCNFSSFLELTCYPMKKILSLVLIVALSAGIFTGCKKDKGVAPALPPAETMIVDFSNFTSGTKGVNPSNWEYAAAVAGVWNVIISTTLAIPVASYKLALAQTPVNIGTKTWQWSYNVTVASVTYKARLTGLIRTTDVQWKMYVSRDGTGGFAEFLWFEGTSKLDGTTGQWILYQSATVTDALLQIDWTKTAAAIGSVKYTYVKNDSFNTSFLMYGLTTASLNAYYTIHFYDFGMAKFSDVNIEWSTIILKGRVKSTNYLLGDWYCWDAKKLDVTCP